MIAYALQMILAFQEVYLLPLKGGSQKILPYFPKERENGLKREKE